MRVFETFNFTASESPVIQSWNPLRGVTLTLIVKNSCVYIVEMYINSYYRRYNMQSPITIPIRLVMCPDKRGLEYSIFSGDKVICTQYVDWRDLIRR